MCGGGGGGDGGSGGGGGGIEWRILNRGMVKKPFPF